MKFLKLAPIAGLLMASSQAFAIPEPTADFKVYAAGASAQLNTISNILTSLCQANVVGGHQIEFYQGYTNASSVNTNLRAFKCTMKTTLGNPVLNGKTVLFSYSAIDGSASGVQYVARQADRTFLNFAACSSTTSFSATTGTGGSAAATVTPLNSKQFNCVGTGTGTSSTLTTTLKKPMAGSSDVEPARFEGDNAPAGETSVTAEDLQNLNVVSSRAVIFGLYANEAMWFELQKRQGLIPTTATAPIMPIILNASNVEIANPAFTEALRPNMSRNEYTALVKGDLNDMKYLAGTPSPVAGTMTTGALHLARRVNGSGTQTISNITFLNNPCGISLAANVSPADASFNGGNFSVSLGSSTSNVLTDLQTKPQATIGVVSLENVQKATNGALKGYGFLKLDNVTPSRANAINGTYQFYAEETFQWNTTVVPGGSDMETFLQKFASVGGEISTLSNLSTAVQAGSAALAANNGGLPSANTTWIMNSSRNGNNCAPAVRIIE